MKEFISDQCMVEEDPTSHPAIDAWLTINPSHSKPAKVTALYAATMAHKKHKKKDKSAVYKLEGTGPDGRSIVAKRCTSTTLKLERCIYETILPELPISSLQYYGDAEMDDTYWLFLEYAGGVEWRIDDKTHLELAIQWLAKMHGSSAQLKALSLLPDRGPRYYLSQLTTARQRIQENISNPAFAPADIEILNDFLVCSSLLDKRWQDIESFCNTMPVTLVHNDFVSKNVHVRTTEQGLILLPFDWEQSGKGVPTTDLFWMFLKAPKTSITRYCEYLREYNTSIDLQDAKQLMKTGVIFRLLDEIEWVSLYFPTESPNKRMYRTKHYTDKLKQAYHALGWS